MTEIDEITQTVQHLQEVLENLVVRGVRSAGVKELTALQNLGGEFERVGANHLAGRIRALHAAMQQDDRSAAQWLLKTQASLRLFERILTLEFAQAALAAFTAEADDEPE